MTLQQASAPPGMLRLLAGAAACILFALILGPAGMLPARASEQAAIPRDHPAFELFREVYDTVHQRNVSPPDDAKLIEGAIKGLVQSLDPHSEYLDEPSFRNAQEEALGVFGGLALKVAAEDGLLRIVSIGATSHAGRVGLKPGDLITRLDGVPIRGMSVNHAVARMRGPVDSKIRVTIARKRAADEMEFVVTRDLIRVQTVFGQAIDNEVGYLRITKFNDLTTDGLRKALQDLTVGIATQRLKGYILDLRNNPGGVFEQAISVANAFLKSGEIITVRGRNPDEDKTFVAERGEEGLAKRKPLIVLINGGSASAAEIVAGALQDNKRATVLGSLSFGKGSVQSTFPVGTDSGALRLTTAFYYTPDGRSIQAKGIAPDIEITQEPRRVQSPRAEITSEATLRNHFKADSVEQNGSESYVPPDAKNDRALKFAVDLLRGTRTHPAFPAN